MDSAINPQEHDPTKPRFMRAGQDATKVPCGACGRIHWIGDCGEPCAWREQFMQERCGLYEDDPAHRYWAQGIGHPFTRPVCTCIIGSSAGRATCPRHWRSNG